MRPSLRITMRSAERHCLFLIMRDKHEGRADMTLDQREFGLQPLAQFQIQGTERFIEQQYTRLVDECAGDRDALGLAAGKLADRSLRERSQANQFQGLPRTGALFVLGHPGHPQPEGHVLQDIQMGKQRVGLEDGVDRAPVGRTFRHIVPADPDHSGGRLDKATDDVQRCRLPQPDGPSRQKNSPSLISRSTGCNATASP